MLEIPSRQLRVEKNTDAVILTETPIHKNCAPKKMPFQRDWKGQKCSPFCFWRHFALRPVLIGRETDRHCFWDDLTLASSNLRSRFIPKVFRSEMLDLEDTLGGLFV